MGKLTDQRVNNVLKFVHGWQHDAQGKHFYGVIRTLCARLDVAKEKQEYMM